MTPALKAGGRLLAHLTSAFVALWVLSPTAPLWVGPAPPVPLRTSAIQLAAATLRDAEHLTGAAIGYAGVTPVEVLAWRVIRRAGDGDSVFLDLTYSPSRVTQLYGLIGLRVGDHRAYEEARARLLVDGSQVSTFIGCVIFPHSMSELIAAIDTGIWSRSFISGRLPD